MELVIDHDADFGLAPVPGPLEADAAGDRPSALRVTVALPGTDRHRPRTPSLRSLVIRPSPSLVRVVPAAEKRYRVAAATARAAILAQRHPRAAPPGGAPPRPAARGRARPPAGHRRPPVPGDTPEIALAGDDVVHPHTTPAVGLAALAPVRAAHALAEA